MDGHLDCFHVLAVISSAAMNIGVYVSFQVSVLMFFPGVYPGVELLGHMLVLFLVFFKEPSYCFPQWLHQFAFPPTV